MPKFDAKKAESFISSDALLLMVYKDLRAKNKKLSKVELLEIVFNSYILDDSTLWDAYENVKIIP